MLRPIHTLLAAFAILSYFYDAKGLGLPNQQHGTEMVGFSAYMSDAQEFTFGQRVIFDTVTVNEVPEGAGGSGYNGTTGQFSCPVDGYYFVSVSMRRYENRSIAARLRSGFSSIFYLRNYWENNNNTVSNSGLVYCNAAESMFVTGALLEGQNTSVAFGAPGEPHSVFNAWLVWGPPSGPLTNNNLPIETAADDSGYLAGYHDDESLTGFSMFKTETQVYDNQDLIPFTGVMYNDGHYFDQISRYNCTKTGTYFINLNFRFVTLLQMHINLERATQTVLSADEAFFNPSGTVTSSRLITCQAGELFQLKASDNGGIYGAANQPHSTFNGLFIAPAVSAPGAYNTQAYGASMWLKENKEFLGEGERLRFDGILWDDDGVYDRVDNEFDCPVDGFYYVSVSVKRSSNRPLNVRTMKESEVVMMHVDEAPQNNRNNVANSAIVRCCQGQSIFIESGGPGTVHGESNFIETSFTAFYIGGRPCSYRDY